MTIAAIVLLALALDFIVACAVGRAIRHGGW
jgi:hypothetical protein